MRETLTPTPISFTIDGPTDHWYFCDPFASDNQAWHALELSARGEKAIVRATNN